MILYVLVHDGFRLESNAAAALHSGESVVLILAVAPETVPA